MEIDLSGRVAVVTGGGKGVGKLFAGELVAAGAAVALVGRTATTLAATAEELRPDAAGGVARDRTADRPAGGQRSRTLWEQASPAAFQGR